MKIRAKIWLENEEGELLLGEGRLDILKAIESCGSISAAARELGMSYRAVWGKVRTAEERLGIKLVDGVAGGPKHGGASLTDAGKQFIIRFEEFDDRARSMVEDLAAGLIDQLVIDFKGKSSKKRG